MNKIIILAFLAFGIQTMNAQSEFELISNTLMDYIEGSTEGQPDRLKIAFHPDLNLYTVSKDKSLKLYTGTEYIESTKEGKPTGEAGKIISVDFENNAAVAKVEISHPESLSTYVDYFMLLKVKDKWTIIHKMYTKRTSNKVVKKDK